MIFRATPQWFAAMDKEIPGGGTLRTRAMKAIGDTKWFPPSGENRIAGMVKDRPDWVLSRQRAWGVPLAIFVEKKTDAILDDAEVNARIVAAFREEGADAWFNAPASRFPSDRAATRTITSRFGTSSTSGSIPARRMCSPSSSRSSPNGRRRTMPISISRLGPASRLVPVVAARKLRERAAARPMTRC